MHLSGHPPEHFLFSQPNMQLQLRQTETMHKPILHVEARVKTDRDDIIVRTDIVRADRCFALALRSYLT